MQKKLIVWDIDGTVADTEPRLHLIKNKPKNWPLFIELSAHDDPIPQTQYIYKALANEPDNVMVVMTARAESEREITETWLASRGFGNHEEMFMRPKGDHRPDWEIKLELLEIIEAKYGPCFMAFEDRPGVIKNCYNKRGTFVLDVGQGIAE